MPRGRLVPPGTEVEDVRIGATDWCHVHICTLFFQIACNELPDLHRGMVPFWIFDPEGGVAIERHVPTIPLSQDEQRYEDLLRSLAVYRMVLGQPRQEDLLAYLVDRVSPERMEELRPLLQIGLRPSSIEE